jgi:hypothetical protein
MFDRFGFSKYTVPLAICLIVAVFLILSVLPSIKNSRGWLEPTVSIQSIAPLVTASITPVFTSTFSQTPLGLNVQTQLPPAPSKDACGAIWGIDFLTPLPVWLKTPLNADGLYTDVKYFLLAGHLISSGIVNASDCPDGGLSLDGTANTCGMEKAYPQVITWQNQFNQAIIDAAQDNQISAEVLKRLFARESQFWPPNYYGPPAYGIGNVSSQGIEPLFRFNETIYQSTCREVFSSQTCSHPYASFPLENQQILRGYFISHYMDAYCETCPNRIDLEKTKSSIDYFAKLLIANCNQVYQLLEEKGSFSQSISYEDAWRLTLATYTRGPTCVANGIHRMDVSKSFSWADFNQELESNCSVDIYLNAIMR